MRPCMVYGKIRAMKLSLEQSSKQIELLKQKRDEQGLTATEKDRLIMLQEVCLDFLEEQFRLAKSKLFASKSRWRRRVSAREEPQAQHQTFCRPYSS